MRIYFFLEPEMTQVVVFLRVKINQIPVFLDNFILFQVVQGLWLYLNWRFLDTFDFDLGLFLNTIVLFLDLEFVLLVCLQGTFEHPFLQRWWTEVWVRCSGTHTSIFLRRTQADILCHFSDVLAISVQLLGAQQSVHALQREWCWDLLCQKWVV